MQKILGNYSILAKIPKFVCFLSRFTCGQAAEEKIPILIILLKCEVISMPCTRTGTIYKFLGHRTNKCIKYRTNS